MKRKRAYLWTTVTLYSFACMSIASCTGAEPAIVQHHEQRTRRLKKEGTKESKKEVKSDKSPGMKGSKKEVKNEKSPAIKESKYSTVDDKKESKKEVKNKKLDGHKESKKESKKEVKNNKKISGDNQGLQMSALYYGKDFGKGNHYVDLWCGTPPQRRTVIVDTTSATTAFPCSECVDCGAGKYHIDDNFDEKNSSTFSIASCDHCETNICSEDRKCIIQANYTKRSFWSAFKARDRCYLGGPHNAPLSDESGTESIDPNHAKALATDLNFGCQTTAAGTFKEQPADGILSMGDDDRSFWSQLYKTGTGGTNNQFSLCFARPLQYNRTGTVAGAITLGGSDTRLHRSPMVFAKRKNTNGFYMVHIRKIYLRHFHGGESARSVDSTAKVIRLEVKETALNEGGVIVDSGTGDTLFNTAIASEFRAAFFELSGKTYNYEKWDLKDFDFKWLPTILVQLQGEKTINKQLHSDPAQVVGLAGDLDPDHPYDVIIAIPPSHYMDLRSDGQYSPRILDTQTDASVLGGNMITGHDVLFDMDRQVIGWAESQCDYHSLVTGNGYRDVLEGPLYREVPDYDSESDDEDDDDDDDSVSNSGYDRAFGSVSMTPELEAAINKLDKELNLKSNTKTITSYSQQTTYDGGFMCYRLDVVIVLAALLIFERFCIGRVFCKSKSSSTAEKKLQVTGANSFDSNSGITSITSSDDDDERVPFVRKRNY